MSDICREPGAPGYEKRIRDLVINEVKPLVDETIVDSMGNVIAIKFGDNKKKEDLPRVAITAHMDEIGFIVNHIDERGFLRFLPLGGFDPKTLTAQRVIVHGKKDVIGVMGSKPIHLMSAEERKKPLNIQDFFIDTGLPKKEVEKLVEIGSTVTRERELIEMGDMVNSKSLDNRISVFVLIEALREMKKMPVDVFAVFTVQEEVGLRGATSASHYINADFGINLDTTIAFDVPGAEPQEQITRLGDGVGIKIMDSSIICDYRMVDFMKKQAKKSKIKWQPELLPAGGTDSAAIQRMTEDGGAIVGALSIPTRNIHQSIEMCHKGDIRGTIDLLKACVANLSSYKWEIKV